MHDVPAIRTPKMHSPPSIPRTDPYLHDPSWTDVIATYAIALAIPVLLWLVSNPVLAVGIGSGLLVSRHVLRRAASAITALLGERIVTIEFGDAVRVTISDSRTEFGDQEVCCA